MLCECSRYSIFLYRSKELSVLSHLTFYIYHISSLQQFYEAGIIFLILKMKDIEV